MPGARWGAGRPFLESVPGEYPCSGLSQPLEKPAAACPANARGSVRRLGARRSVGLGGAAGLNSTLLSRLCSTTSGLLSADVGPLFHSHAESDRRFPAVVPSRTFTNAPSARPPPPLALVLSVFGGDLSGLSVKEISSCSWPCCRGHSFQAQNCGLSRVSQKTRTEGYPTRIV